MVASANEHETGRTEAGGVPGLRRGLAILRLLATSPEPLPAATIAARLGLPRSSTYHLLAELHDAGVVAHLPERRRWAVGLAAFEIGAAYLRHDPLERLAAPALTRLAGRIALDVHLGVLHGRELLYLVRARPPRPSTLVTAVGVRLPAHLTASGRAILAGIELPQRRAVLGAGPFPRRTERGPATLRAVNATLDADRRRGWSIEDGEVSQGFASVAHAVPGPEGTAVAGVSVTFPHHCDPPCGSTFDQLAAQVARATREITRRLGGTPAPVLASDARGVPAPG
ncbi:IclR family transcriptional regulator [Actinomycetospora cinnamomea]|uniref:IclR family transcriptional regulator n=1 Tax=Actinomycetospora cinnamomea TaxID=663609 RepID=A0A2U1EZI4_9PSEU|nr:IclR family transcriptional regulator [Actinomycetospora cinnamomea]